MSAQWALLLNVANDRLTTGKPGSWAISVSLGQGG